MSQTVEHLVRPNLETIISYIREGDPTATPPVKPLQYGETLTSAQLTRLNIPSTDPAATLNSFLSNPKASINDPDTSGGYNCLMYDNTKGLINNYSKDPIVCSMNEEAKCTLSAFTDGQIETVTSTNEKSYTDYRAFIGSSGLQLSKETVSCGDKTNILMWVYKDAQSGSVEPDAIGIPVNQCSTLDLNKPEIDLSSSTSAIKAICEQPKTYALVEDDVTGAGYKCKLLPPETPDNPINSFKCNNL